MTPASVDRSTGTGDAWERAMTSPDVTPIVPKPGDLDAIVYDDRGLVPVIVQDVATEAVLMLAWMNAETLQMSLEQGRTVFWSRSRGEIWRKGDSSGNRQYLRSVLYDCDGDVLLVRVEQEGAGACHTGEYSCFFNRIGESDRP